MTLKRAVPLILITLGLLLAGVLISSQGSGSKTPPRVARVLPLPAPNAGVPRRGSTAGRVDIHAAPPRRIQIPAIGVSAKVIALGLNRDRTIQTPKAWGEAGWYEP